MKTLLRIMYLTVIVFLLNSCVSKNEKEPTVSLNINDSILESENKAIKTQFFFTLPAPGEMLQFFTTENVLAYKENIINDTKNSSKYVNEISMALNLGVFTTDFAYATFYEKKKISNNILRVSQKLAENLNINMFINKDFIDEVEQFISNIEVDQNFPNEVFYEMVNNLESAGREELLSFIMTGSFIETLYVMVNIIDGSEHSEDLIRFLGDQKYVLDNLIEYVKSNAHGDNYTTISNYLNEIQLVFDSTDIIKNEIEVSKIDSGKIYISGGNTYVLTDGVFDSLRIKITEIRESIVSR